MEKHKPLITTFIMIPLMCFASLWITGCDNEDTFEARVSNEVPKGFIKAKMYTTNNKVMGQFDYDRQIVSIESHVTIRGEVAGEQRTLTIPITLKATGAQGESYELDCSDPLIVQFPEDANNFIGTFDDGNETSGSLIIENGLDTIALGSDSTMNAEPGQQLVIMSMPPNISPGLYELSLEFDLATIRDIQIKPVISAKVTCENNIYFPILIPDGFTSLSATQAVTIPVSDMLMPISLPLDDIGGSSTVSFFYPGSLVHNVDNFESYDGNCNCIFFTWTDGYGHFGDPCCSIDPYAGNLTGSIIGNYASPYTEQVVVCEGYQSMPFYYDNSGVTWNIQGSPITAFLSEAKRTFNPPLDWTGPAINFLSLWFHGDPCNVAEPMYIIVQDSAGINATLIHEDPNASLTANWEEWAIDLQEFSDRGIDLAEIRSLTLGFGDRDNPRQGGQGLVFFDDIKHYRDDSALLFLLHELYFTDTEMCCLPSLGIYPVPEGRCISLCGFPAANGYCSDQNDVPDPNFLWLVRPPSLAIDDLICVEVIPDPAIDIDIVTFDLLPCEQNDTTTGPIRLEELPAGPLGSSISTCLDLTDFSKGDYSLIVTGWKLDQQVECVILEYINGNVIPSPSNIRDISVLTSLSGPFRLKPTYPDVPSDLDLAILASVAPYGTEPLTTLIDEVVAAREELLQVQRNLSTMQQQLSFHNSNSPVLLQADESDDESDSEIINNLQELINTIQDLKDEYNRRLDEYKREMNKAETAKKEIEDKLHALTRANLILSLLFRASFIQNIEKLLNDRENLLKGLDLPGYSDSLQKELNSEKLKRQNILDDLDTVNNELQGKKDQLEKLTNDIKEKIVETTFDKIPGDSISKYTYSDENGFTYDFKRILGANSGKSQFVEPWNDEYKQSRNELDKMNNEWKKLAEEIKGIEKKQDDLKRNEQELAKHISTLESGESKIADRIDDKLDSWLGTNGNLPHNIITGILARIILAELQKPDLGNISDLIRSLFGNAPRDMDEFTNLKIRLDGVRHEKHSLESALNIGIDVIKDRITNLTEQYQPQALENDVNDLEKRKEQLVEQLEDAQEQAREPQQATLDEKKNAAEAESIKQEREQTLETLVGPLVQRVRQGDEEARATLMREMGFNVVDDITSHSPGKLRLGTMLCNLMTFPDDETPDCVCKFLNALMAAFENRSKDQRIPMYDQRIEAAVSRWNDCASMLPYDFENRYKAFDLRELVIETTNQKKNEDVLEAILRVYRMKCK